MKLLYSLFVPLFFALSVMPFPQSAPAEFRGVITDTNDGRISKVSVLVENGGNKWGLQSNEDGEFNIDLPAGEYKFTLDPLPGFKKLIVSNFRISAGAKISYKFEMQIRECSDCELTGSSPEPAPSATPSSDRTDKFQN